MNPQQKNKAVEFVSFQLKKKKKKKKEEEEEGDEYKVEEEEDYNDYVELSMEGANRY